jgi:hypothetical protein
VVPCQDRPRSVPLVTGLCRSSGNAGKIAMAKDPSKNNLNSLSGFLTFQV